MRFVLSLLACLSLAVAFSPAVAEPHRWIGAVDDDLLEGTAWGRVAEQYHLDPWLLYAISIEESGHFDPRTGKLYPWRWIIHHNHKVTYHDNEAQARAHIDSLEAQGISNYDIGPLQINRRWNGDKVDHPYELLTVHKSLEVAAGLLAETRTLSPSDKHLWVGRYRSWNTERARAFADRIFHIRLQLPKGRDYEGYGEPLWVRR